MEFSVYFQHITYIVMSLSNNKSITAIIGFSPVNQN